MKGITHHPCHREGEEQQSNVADLEEREQEDGREQEHGREGSRRTEGRGQEDGGWENGAALYTLVIGYSTSTMQRKIWICITVTR